MQLKRQAPTITIKTVKALCTTKGISLRRMGYLKFSEINRGYLSAENNITQLGAYGFFPKIREGQHEITLTIPVLTYINSIKGRIL